ncbi:hypothetical protein AALP_AA3G079100 [Arabis alpina]|uniref:Ninja-family protein n=1 Tax=Arabis alpina TaxID=50452 RepID=A0A087H7S3_ARAAL|nr:hypothetical protein AALP_AA3G079100 [Arabis alpina]
MVVESLSMATKFGEDDDVELELCLSLGGPFKKTDKTKPIETRTVGEVSAVRYSKDIDVNVDGGRTNATRRKREAKQQQRGAEEGECKRMRTECNGNVNGVTNGVELDLSFSKMGNGYGSGQVTIGSPICSSSDVSDPSSSSRQEGGSCEYGVNSDQTKPAKSPVKRIGTGNEETMQSINGSTDDVVVENQDRSNSVANDTRKPPKPRPNGNGSLLPFAQMPCVTSTGNGPEGKTVNGFLYRYSKSEISIICVCHGTSFSPAEFIVHAGGTNVTHPLRHITVVPSMF